MGVLPVHYKNRNNPIKNSHSELKQWLHIRIKQPDYNQSNHIKVTSNYEMVDIVTPFPNYFSKMSHTIANINALTTATVTPRHEYGALDLQLILPLLLSTRDRS